MSDTNKPDEDKEPVDAEFETLDADTGATPPIADKSRPGTLRWLIILGGIGLAIGLILVGRLFVFTGQAPAKPEAGIEDIAALTLRLDTLQDHLKSLQLQTTTDRDDILARLKALESVPAKDMPYTIERDDLQNRLVALENAGASDAQDTAYLQELAQRLDRLEAQRLAVLENTVPNTVSDQSRAESATQLDAMQSEIETLRSRIKALENKSARTGGKAKQVLALLALDSTAQSGAPFEREWRTLSQLLPLNADVMLLAPLARTGVPGRAALIRNFTQTLPNIRAAAGQDPTVKPGMMGKVKGAFGSLISVRRVDDKAKGVDAVLARAEAALRDDDLAGAIAALNSLDKSARTTAQGWITQAQTRLTLEQALARLKVVTVEASL